MFKWFKSKGLPRAEELRAKSDKYKRLAEEERLRNIDEAIRKQNLVVDFEIKHAHKSGKDCVQISLWLYGEVKDLLTSLGYKYRQEINYCVISWDK